MVRPAWANSSKKAANRIIVSVTKFLEEKLGLKVNIKKSKLDRPNGIKYLLNLWFATKLAIIFPPDFIKLISQTIYKIPSNI